MAGDRLIRPILFRAAGCLLLWVVLAGLQPEDLPAIIVAVVAGTYVSLRLAPPTGGRVSVPALLRLAVRFPVQSLIAGMDVARRALAPGLPIRPGYISVPTNLPPGGVLDAFRAYASLMPGTVPTEVNEDGMLLVHCLDTTQPEASRMQAEEARFAAVIRPSAARG